MDLPPSFRDVRKYDEPEPETCTLHKIAEFIRSRLMLLYHLFKSGHRPAPTKYQL